VHLKLQHLVPFLMILLVLSASPASSAPRAVPHQQLTCDELVILATTTVGLACDGLGRNQVCYGNRQIDVEFIPNSTLTFNRSGDRVDLLELRTLSTFPFDSVTGDWGVAFLKAQANLPDALPGENVTFLLFGDATLENVTSDMRAVKLTSGITGTECDEAPSGVLIQSPAGQQVTMNINGADLTLGSTVFLSAKPNVSMKLSTIEGLAVITSMGETRIVPEGGETGVLLGGLDGLEPIGPPAPLRGFTQIELPFLPLDLLDSELALPPPLNIAGAMGTVTPTTAPVGAATSSPATCLPRTDWTARYVVQPGDTLSAIAARAGVRLEDFMAGNCIVNAARLLAGQTLNSPIAIAIPRLPTATVTTVRPVASITPTATTNAGIVGPNLRADANPIFQGSCTVIRWDVSNIREVYFNGTPAIGSEGRQVCPSITQTYTLRVLRLDNVTQDFPITIYVETTCGNYVCEAGENATTCPIDCYQIG